MNARTMNVTHARHTRLTRHVGFTLVELLVTLSIITLLLAMLLPAMKSARKTARTAVCASNLHEIHHAWMDQAIEARQAGTQMIGGWGGWVGVLGRSVVGQTKVFICPEDDHPAIAPEATIRVLSFDNATFNYYMPLEVGPLTRMANESGTPGQPGYSYDMEFEDIRPSGGDMDFNDLVVNVTLLDDGTAKITFVNMSAGYHFYLDDLSGRELLPDLGRATPLGASVILGGRASYAVNGLVRRDSDRSNSIFFMDYVEKTTADPDLDDWSLWLNDEGVPAFGRHPYGQCNVMFRDGSIRLMSPFDIDFDVDNNRDRWWRTQTEPR
ncbi:MAG: prepilin-type N-terminal cleavage/methylation domain-containing protein [Phycisphaera sp.]|nr:prepilin-type N-terminal cleavage/methylation domain-containing protein [Phycisphaera sp.]